MALILKQEANANVTTPPAGSGAVFLNASDQLTVKDSAGNTSAIPTFTATNNTAVFFNDAGALGENANLTFVKTTNTLTVLGNVDATGVKTDNLYYANGNPWDLSDPGGSNTQIQFNDNESFGGSANFVWDNSSNTLTVTGTSNVTGTMNVTGNITANNVGAGNLLTANFVAGTLTTNAQPNITSVGTLSTLTTSGNAIIGGNLVVNGNITYVNVENFSVEDPIISIGGGANGDPLTSNDGKDRGTALQYYTSAPVTAFMGWDNGNSEFAFGSNVSISSDVVTYTTLGNVRASTLLGNVVGATANFTGNVTAANANLGNTITGNYFTGVLTYAAQPNITSVGILTSLEIGATADKANDFPNATTVSSQDNTGDGVSAPIGLVGEAVADSANNIQAFGLYGVARANGAGKGTGVQGTALVTNTADTGAAVGVRGYATDTHSGGYNIGVLGNAIGSGVGNYAFYVQNGGIASIENDTFWDLADNSETALTFNSTGKANIFGIETTDNAEGIFTSGYLNVTGNVAAGGVKTDNLYYANGSPWDLQQAGGSNTQIQFNDADSFGGSAAFTFNKTSNLVSMGGALSVTGNANIGNIGTAGQVIATGNVTAGNVSGGNLVSANFVSGTLTTAAQPNITSTGTLTSLTVTGNVTGGNLVTGGVLSVTGNGTFGNVSATGNVSAGNISSSNAIFATGDISGGNLTTSGQVSATGNVSGGNLNSGGVIESTGNITTQQNLIAEQKLYVGNNATLVTLLNPVIIGSASGETYVQGALLNENANGSADWVAYGDNGNTDAGWVDIGFNGSTFNDANYTITKPNDGYVLVQSVNGAGLGGNLVLATGDQGANNDIVFATGGFLANNENMRLRSAEAQLDIQMTTPATNTTTGAVVVAGGMGIDGNVYTGGLISTAGNLIAGGVVSANGNVSGGNLTTGGVVAATGNVSGGNLTTGGALSVTGNANVGNIGATNGVFTNVSGNGSALSSITGANVTGTVSSATTAGTVTTAAQPNITSVGTLGNLSVTANITGGNLNTVGNVNASIMVDGGTGIYLAAGPSGYINFFTTGGDKATITDTGNITGSNVVANSTVFATTANISGNVNAGNLVTSGALSVTGNANVGNLGATGVIATTVGGTLTTAAQPNITSVGTLTNLTVTGTTTAGNLSTGGTLSVTGNANVGNLGTNGLITANGNVSGGNLTTSGIVAASGNVTSGAQVIATGNVTGGNIITAGLVSATGNVSGGNITTGGVVAATGNITSSANIVATSNVSGGNLTTSGVVSATGNVTGGNITTTGVVTATGNVTGGNLVTGGVVSATGNITGGNVIATGNLVANGLVSASGDLYLYAQGTNSNINLNTTGVGTISAGNSRITFLATPTLPEDAVTKAYVDSAVSTGLHIHEPVLCETQSNLNATYSQGGTTPTVTTITNNDTLTTSTSHGLSVNDQITFGSSTNGITAGYAYFVYSVPAADQITLTATYQGTEITSLTNGTGLSITSRANPGVGATLTNAGTQAALVVDGISVATNDRVLVNNQTDASRNGVYVVTTVGNGSTNWLLTRSSDQNMYSPQDPDGMGNGDYFFVQSGTVAGGQAHVLTNEGSIIIGTTPLTYTLFSDSGAYLAGTGLQLDGFTFSVANTLVTAGSYGNGDRVATFTVNQQGQLTAASNVAITSNAANLTGTTLNATIVNSSLTSVGTLGSLAVTANVTAGNVYANTGTIGASLLTGTLTTAAQPNITSTGTLTSLTVTGTATAGNLSTGGTLSVTGNANVGNLGTGGLIVATGNITGGNLVTNGVLSVTGNANVGNIGATNGVFTNVSGNGSSLSSITGANVTGAVAFATTANSVAGGNVSGQVSNALVASTVYTAAQPNITSVGTLTSLAVTGNITAGNVSATTFTGALSGTATSATTAGTVTTAAQPNITSVGTLSSLVVSGNATVSGILKANSTNVVTNSADFPSFQVNGGMIIYGNLLPLGNTFIGVAGGAAGNTEFRGNALTTGANTNAGTITGAWTLSTGSTLVASSANSATTAGTITTAAQPNITSTGTLTSLTVTGNVAAGNVTTAGQLVSSVATGTAPLVVTSTTQVANLNVATAGLAGYVTAAAQSNITSVGTLSSLTVSGNVGAGNVSATGGVFTYVTGNGANLSAIAGGNVTGQVGNALVAGTVYTAAQPNITSVGTLSSLAVTANANVGNLNASGKVIATDNLIIGSSGGEGGQLVLGYTGISGITGQANGTWNVDVDSSNNFRIFTQYANGAASTPITVYTANSNIGFPGSVLSSGTIGGASATLFGTTLTTGSNTTAGTMTGNFSLSAGSRLNATYADLAERYVADMSYEPGTVVVFGGEHEVSITGEADSTRVAGVVSTNPAYLMNAECEGEHVVDLALMGRVPCKVIGPVVKGDLITTSEIAGFGKANNEARAGSIIGKALENYNGPTPDGIIEVLVGRC